MPEIECLAAKHKFDILSLSETWLNQYIQNTTLALYDYNLYRHDRLTPTKSKKGGGVATYVSTKYHTISDKYTSLNFSNPAIESQTLYVTKENHKATVFVNIYRPPSGDKETFADHINQILETISLERYADLYLTGDFNLDHASDSKTAFTSKLENSINSYGLVQVVNEYTRQTTSSKSLIDVLYVKTGKQTSPFTLKLSLSDHYLIGATIYHGYKKDPSTTFLGRSYRNYNFEIAKTFYSSLDLEFILQYNDVDLVWTSLKRYMLTCVHKFCPLRQISTKLHQPKWFTKELNELLYDRDQAFLEAYNYPDNPTLLEKAKKLRTKAKKSIRNARADHINEQLSNHSDDPQKVLAGTERPYKPESH